jgi:Flp pilus assembly protein TadD
MLKIVEVLVLIGAGLGFVLWQFRDLRRAREITRQQLEAQQAEAMHAKAASDESLKEKDADGG